jgi:hypothetical protein
MRSFSTHIEAMDDLFNPALNSRIEIAFPLLLSKKKELSLFQ